MSARAINDAGVVVGTVIMGASVSGSRYRAFRWSPAGWLTLLPIDVDYFGPMGVDDNGNVVGVRGDQPPRTAVIWNDATGVQPLNVQLPFLNTLGVNAGWIFGNALVSDPRRPIVAFRMDIQSRRFVELQTRSEDGGGVLSMNRRGEAAGYDGNIDYGFGGTSDAVLWDQAGTRTVAYSCGGVWDCYASLIGITANGTAVGMVTKTFSMVTKSDYQDSSRAFRWSRATGVEYLADPSGVTNGISVAGLSDDGRILASTRELAFIIEPSGPATLLPLPAGYKFVQPRAMNRRGEVIGMLF